MSEIIMSVDRLDIVPRGALPGGYRVRNYREGDEATWMRIHRNTGFYDPVPPDLFRREFGHDEEALKARQLFVEDDSGNAVATATAWSNDPAHGVDGGRIHWVAVDPAVQRHGIASALLGALCDRFAELGYESAYLTTGGHNHKAIALYEKHGFVHRGPAEA